MKSFGFAAVLLSLAHGEQLSLSSSASLLAERLAEVELSGKGRNAGVAAGSKQFVDRLLVELGQKSNLGPAEIAILGQIITLLEQILSDLIAENVVDQGMLDPITATITACEAALVGEDTTLTQQAQDDLTAHNTCRGEQKTVHDDKVTKCDAVEDTMNNLNAAAISHHCVYPDAGESHIEAWRTLLNGAHAAMTSQQTTFIPIAQACTDALATLASKDSACDALQATFEAHWCEASDKRTQRCDDLETCYNNAVTAHNDIVSGFAAVVDQREKDAQSVSYIKCLCEQMQGGTTDIDAMTAACDGWKTADYSNYVPNYPTITPWATVEAGCDRSDYACGPDQACFADHYSTVHADVRPSVLCTGGCATCA